MNRHLHNVFQSDAAEQMKELGITAEDILEVPILGLSKQELRDLLNSITLARFYGKEVDREDIVLAYACRHRLYEMMVPERENP